MNFRAVKVVISSFFVLALICIVGIIVIPTMMGKELFAVKSRSMYPVLDVGDLVVVQKVSIDDIHIGDILTFRSADGKSFTHRVSNINYSDGLIETKGDANVGVDPGYTSFEYCVGRVTNSYPLIGYIYLVMSSDIGNWLFAIILLIFLSFELEFYIKRKLKSKEVQ